jgi:tight adherence protein B
MSAVLVRLVTMVAVFAAVFLIAQVLLRLSWQFQADRAAVNERLRMLRAGHDRDRVADTLLKNAPPRLSPDAGWLEKAHVAFVRTLMVAAIRIDARQILLRMGLAFAAVVVLALFLVSLSGRTVTLGVLQLVLAFGAALAFALPLLLINRKAQKRRRRMEELFPVALDIFSRSLHAGHPIASAIALVAEEMDDPVGSEFGLVSDEVSYGAELNDALAAMAERWDLEDIRMFVVSVSVQSETGGNLAEIIENLTKVIRERAALFLKVRALSSEGRMTGWMLTVLPVFTFVSMFLMNPAFYIEVAQDRIFTIGFPCLFALYAIGILAIRRITDIKV